MVIISSMESDFKSYGKTPRVEGPWCCTEKIDGTNAAIVIGEAGSVRAGSKNRWLTPGKTTDNFGFAAWVEENQEYLATLLGPGHHYGEWFGRGIQRGYGLTTREFALFDYDRYKKLVRPFEQGGQDILWTVPVVAETVEDVRFACTPLSITNIPSYINPEFSCEGFVFRHKHNNKLVLKQIFKGEKQ